MPFHECLYGQVKAPCPAEGYNLVSVRCFLLELKVIQCELMFVFLVCSVLNDHGTIQHILHVP